MELYIQPTPTSDQSASSSGPSESIDILDLIDQLTSRILASERLIEQKVSTNALAKILITEEDIVLMANKISLVGQINMFDWVRDISGNLTGGIDPSSMTRIVGGKIQTGVIESTNWSTALGSRIDLNNGTIVLGGTTPWFSVSNTGVLTCENAVVHGTLQANSVITNSCTVDGVTMSTIASNASSALSGLSNKLEAGTSYTLTGVVEPTNSGAIKCGSITWNSSTGALTGGSGIAITEYGIIGAASGVAKFTIDTSGNATFSGALSAATGTFTGAVNSGSVTGTTYLSTSGYISASGLVTSTSTVKGVSAKVVIEGVAATGTSGFYTAGVIGYNSYEGSTGSGQVGLYGRAKKAGTSSFGVYGDATDGNIGVAGVADNGGYGVWAAAAAGSTATALAIDGKVTKSRVNAQLLKVYDTSTHALVGTYEYSFE